MTTQGSALPPELIDKLVEKNVWQSGCPVPLERLAVVKINYLDFEGSVHDDGELIVMDAIAPRVERVFAKLLDLKFPIARIKSLHHYDGDDDRSMADNNSSCFNFRPIAGSKTVSMHGYGLAIDLNPVQNPYLTFEEKAGIAKINPPEGWSFINRTNQKPGMIEPVVSLFGAHGFTVWGGRWTTPIDYHHFQAPRIVAELLCAMTPEEATHLFEEHAQKRLKLKETSTPEESAELVWLYKNDKEALHAKIGLQTV
jgi:hypothetical protein